MKDFNIKVSYDKEAKKIEVSDGTNWYGEKNVPNGTRATLTVDTFLLENGYLDEDGLCEDGIELEEGEE